MLASKLTLHHMRRMFHVLPEMEAGITTPHVSRRSPTRAKSRVFLWVERSGPRKRAPLMFREASAGVVVSLSVSAHQSLPPLRVGFGKPTHGGSL